MSNELTKQGASSIVPKTIDEAIRFAELISKSDIVPSDYRNKPGNCFVAMQMGMEVGLGPLQSIQNIACINGRPSIWGDAVLALVKSDPKFEWIKEEFDEDSYTAICTIKRQGEPEVRQKFGREDAIKAGIWEKNVHKTYPKRMLQMRARGFACRDAAPHRLKGLYVAEESMDLPPEKYMGQVQTAEDPEPKARTKPAAFPEYPESDMEKNLSKWGKIIESGKKTPDQIISTIATKYILSEDQKTRIKDLDKPIPDPSFPEDEADDFYTEAETENADS